MTSYRKFCTSCPGPAAQPPARLPALLAPSLPRQALSSPEPPEQNPPGVLHAEAGRPRRLGMRGCCGGRDSCQIPTPHSSLDPTLLLPLLAAGQVPKFNGNSPTLSPDPHPRAQSLKTACLIPGRVFTQFSCQGGHPLPWEQGATTA